MKVYSPVEAHSAALLVGVAGPPSIAEPAAEP